MCCVWSHDHLVRSAFGNECQQNSRHCVTFCLLQLQIPILIKCISSEHASLSLSFSVTLSFFVVFAKDFLLNINSRLFPCHLLTVCE